MKPLDEFPRNRRRRDGRGGYCKPCYSVRYRRYREKQAAEQGRTVRPRLDVPADQKYCPSCDTVLPRGAFGRNRGKPDGLTAYCRPCHNRIGRMNKERLYGSTRDYHLRRRYGLTSADVEAMIAAQGGRCAVCDSTPQHVDHDHATGRVRGILCSNCNQALGNVRDDVHVLEGLVRYLREDRDAG